MTMEQCDVLIVGGGPAGSSCAWKLHRAGLDVVVVDKKSFPRDKVCAGWITPAVIQSLELDTAEYSAGRVFQPIRRFVTGIIGGRETQTDYPEAVSFGIRRCEFDDYLLKRSGARLFLGQPVKSLRSVSDGWVVNESIQAPLIVGAGGHFCPVAKYLAPERGNSPIIAAQEVEFELTTEQQAECTVKGDRPELFFCRDLKGYGWCFRKGDYLNIGLGREGNHQLAQHVSDFVEFLRARGKIPHALLDRFHGHAYLLYQRSVKHIPVSERALLIGDAVGLAYPQSGEGIRPAVESGLMAAETIIEARGNYQTSRLQKYAQRLRRRFGEPQKPVVLPNGLKERLGGFLLSNAPFTRHVVLDRWFLHRSQPPLTVSF